MSQKEWLSKKLFFDKLEEKRVFEIICSILDEMGFVILEKNDDFAISDYISDSIQFISFIIRIEEKIGKNLPDEFLSFEILKSAKGFSNKLSTLFC